MGLAGLWAKASTSEVKIPTDPPLSAPGAKPAVLLAAALSLAAPADRAAAQSLPAEGRYQCSGGSSAAELNFAVGPGNIYTTAKGRRGTLVIHPGTDNVLFRGAPPHDAYEARYSAGPPPQLALLNETGGGATSDAGIVCRMH